MGKFEWHPNEDGILIGGCMNGQVLIWDISEYVAKLESNISIWDHAVIMEKQTDKLHIQDGFIPVLHWSAESNLKASHKSQIEALHWLPSNVWVSKLKCKRMKCRPNLNIIGSHSTLYFLHISIVLITFIVQSRKCLSKAKP